jgi:molecular chaperone GrpE (heat shock protein)
LQSTKILQHEETVSQSSTLKRDFVLALIELRDQLLRPKLEPDLDKGKLVTYISKLAMTKLGRLGVVEICEADLSIASDLQAVDDYVPTNNPDLHRRIAATIQVGYKTDDEVIRSQKVVVYNLAGPEGA